MKVATLALGTALLFGVASSSASALPLVGTASGLNTLTLEGVTDSAVTKVDTRHNSGHKGGNRGGNRGGSKPHYRAGAHLSRAPGGWHRFNARPSDWNTRGCVVVGPIWWCP